jgi:peroxiredoxin
MSPAEATSTPLTAGESPRALDRGGHLPLESVRRVRDLTGTAVPTKYVEQLNGSVATYAEGCRWLALYFFSQIEDNPDRSGVFHRAFSRQHRDLAEAGVAVAGVCSDPPGALGDTVFANGLVYPLLADERLLFAAGLGLPTFSDGARQHYEHLALLTTVPHPGVIGKVFYPLHDLGAVPRQILAWCALNP